MAFLYAQIFVPVCIKTRTYNGHDHSLSICRFLFESASHFKYTSPKIKHCPIEFDIDSMNEETIIYIAHH